MNSTKILLATLLATLLAPAFAAEAEGDPGQQPRIVTREAIEIHTRDGDKTVIAPMMRMRGKLVKNAPYSAEVVMERQQNLADGNQIVNKTSSLSYRDSAGRTRQEVRDAKGEVLTVTIHDAADGSTYILNPRSKTANKIAPGKELGKVAGEMARAHIEQLRKEGKLPAGERREIIIRRFDGAEVEAQANAAVGGVNIEAPPTGAMPNGRELALRLGPLAGAMGDMKWAGKATTKDLGTREIEGVKAEGKLRSYEIPAGEVGNRNAITVSDESWYSPELQVTLLTKHSDPRVGASTYRVTSIRREEPAAALFTVPSDYTVKDVMANVTRILEKKAQ